MTQLQTLSIFVVGFEEGRKIDELGPLKDLKGKLSLLHLEQVKSKKEAKAANLVRKENISDLLFEWSVEREDGDDNDLSVLKGLQPHENVQALRIHNFAGELLPNCIFVENLVELNLDYCKKCETLPMLGQLSKLEVLKINELSAVKSIGSQFYGNYCDSISEIEKTRYFANGQFRAMGRSCCFDKFYGFSSSRKLNYLFLSQTKEYSKYFYNSWSEVGG